MDLGKKLKLQREKKGFSQQELADESGVSIRTIQRIENGQNQPQGFTLRAICESLGVSPEDLYDAHLVENKGIIQALHLSTLTGIVIPWGNIVAPAIIWLANKGKYHQLDRQAKNLILFQAILSVLLALPLLLTFINMFTTGDVKLPKNPTKIVFIYPFLPLTYTVIYPLICILIIQLRGVKDFYPPVFKK